MKYRFILISIILIAIIASCKKDKLDNEDKLICNEFCVNRIFNNPDSIIVSSEKLNVIKNLFETNSIDYTNLQFVNHVVTGSGIQSVSCNQFVNSVKILYPPSISFYFESTGDLRGTSVVLIEEINLSSEPSNSMNCVVESFINKLSLYHLFDETIEEIKSGCFEVEFGYYDLNAKIINANTNIVKAWRINRKGFEYPYALVNDVNLEILIFNNGWWLN